MEKEESPEEEMIKVFENLLSDLQLGHASERERCMSYNQEI